MKNQINNIIIVLSLILIVPATLKWIFGYEIPGKIQIGEIEINSWTILNTILFIVISYVIYTHVMKFIRQKKEKPNKENSNE